jgi:hypothetical protein
MPSDHEIRQILNGPVTSHWLKNALTSALDRNPVDAINDALCGCNRNGIPQPGYLKIGVR